MRCAIVRGLFPSLLLAMLSFGAAAEDFTNALHAYLEQCVHAEILNGCIVVGLLDEHGSRVVCCGPLDNGSNLEANGDTVFQLHSMTGTFTQMLLQSMIDGREMKLEDPASLYLPNTIRLPTYHGKKITIGCLAGETSGLPDAREYFRPKRADNPLADFTLEKLDAFVSGCQLTNEPGARHLHGAVDKGLLGQAMALKAGTSFESLMVERICAPLKLESTRFTLTPELKSRLANEHNRLGYARTPQDWQALNPLAGLYSTANDLLRYLSAIERPPATLAPLMAEWVSFFPYVSPGGTRAHTGGGAFGCRAQLCYDKARRRGLVLLSTSADLMRNFCDYLIESDWETERRPISSNLGPGAYAAYAGQYRPASAALASCSVGIRGEGERLFAQAIGSSSLPTEVLLLPPIAGELLPQSETRFFERLSGKPVTFSWDARGEVTGLTLEYQGKAISYLKFSEQPPKAPEPAKLRAAIKLDPKLLDTVVGLYVFAPKAPFGTGAQVTIWREGDQLSCEVQGENAVQGAFHIYPESETSFFIKLNGAQLTFMKNGQGEVISVIHHSARPGVPDAEGKRVPAGSQ